jgi:UDP-glucose 4-epimerase
LVVGGAGFIGSHFVDRLLEDRGVAAVGIFDNLSSGSSWHYAHHAEDRRLTVYTADVKDLAPLREAMEGYDVVIHLASNPDIAKAETEPSVDFYNGTLLTHNIVESMRTTSAKRILYASGSGVYGDLGELEARENYGPMLPISTYAASKLAGETLISAYSHMFGLTGCAFRFANVVGPRQTHGVGFDFVRRLLDNPSTLHILGDGSQSKSYIHVDDVVDAVLLAEARTSSRFDVYNVATGDYINVREIADLAVECVGLPSGSVQYVFTGGDRGWKGDVPVVRLTSERIAALGWTCQRSSRDALRAALLAMVREVSVAR